MNAFKWFGVVWCGVCALKCGLISLLLLCTAFGPANGGDTGMQLFVGLVLAGIAFLWFLGLRALLRSLGQWAKPVKKVTA
jgi:hypothetical protein